MYKYIVCAMAGIGLMWGVAYGVDAGQPRNKIQWNVYEEAFSYRYREPGLMRNTGIMSGLAADVTYRSNPVLKAQGRLAWGQVDYRSVNTGSQNDIDDVLFETRALAGYDFAAAQGVSFPESMLMPYVGIGYRYLNDDSSGTRTTTGHAGYERESQYIYSPIGIEVFREYVGPVGGFGQSWGVGATLEYDLFWWGRQTSFLSDVNPAFSDLRNNQDKGYGVRGSLKFQVRSQQVDVFISPFVNYWSIKKSHDSNIYYSGTIWGYGWDPKNNTTEIGCAMGIRF